MTLIIEEQNFFEKLFFFSVTIWPINFDFIVVADNVQLNRLRVRIDREIDCQICTTVNIFLVNQRRHEKAWNYP